MLRFKLTPRHSLGFQSADLRARARTVLVFILVLSFEGGNKQPMHHAHAPVWSEYCENPATFSPFALEESEAMLYWCLILRV